MKKKIVYIRYSEPDIDKLIKEKNLYDHVIEINYVQAFPPQMWAYEIVTNLTEWPEN